jgi:hypothetical protein
MRSLKHFRTFVAFLVLAQSMRLPAAAQAPQGGLRIVIVEGEGAINNVRQRVNRDPIVQVEDENRRPVAGAVVVFFLPDSGPSGTFVNGTRQLVVTTGADGRATAVGIRPNDQTGPMQIRVTASAAGETASAVINQTNAVGGGGGAGMSTGMKWLIGLGIAGAVAGGIVAGTRSGGGGTPPAPPAIVLTPGSPTVGGPR